MFNTPELLAQDRNEAAKRERAKQWEEERKPRIFNARQRLIGVDVPALNKQLHERKILKDQLLEEEKAYVRKRDSDNVIAQTYQRVVDDNRKKLTLEVQNFRRQFQKKEDRREFDLNDPEALRKSLPCRLLDDDPRISISSVQKFEGEDGTAKIRQRAQREQQRSWLLQQMAEKRKSELERQAAEKLYSESVAAQEERALFLEETNDRMRKELEVSTLQFNLALATEQAAAKRLEELRDNEDKRQEIYNAINSDFLTENPDAAQSNLGVDKIIGACYKGMTRDQREAIKKTQQKQIEEIKDRRRGEKENDRQWQELMNTHAHKKILDEKGREKERKDILRKMFEENDRLREEQKAQREYLNKVVYTNVPTAAFYEQFNRTTR